MRQLTFSRTALFAAAAMGGLLLTGGAALAQVRIFEQAPSIEQLRNIMIPESRPGQSRSIVLLRADTMPRTNAVQAAMVQQDEPAPMAQPAMQPMVQPNRVERAPMAAEPVRPTMTAAPRPRRVPNNRRPTTRPGSSASASTSRSTPPPCPATPMPSSTAWQS